MNSLVDDFRLTEKGDSVIIAGKTFQLAKGGAWVSNDWLNNVAEVNGVGE